MDLLHSVRTNLHDHRMVDRGCKVLVAVSGGPDSVALLHILFLLRDEFELSLHVVHLNHMFRGRESEEDAAFVTDLAAHYGLPVTVNSIDVPAYRDQNRLSGQIAAREIRYRFFCEKAQEEKASKVALAHQADDQAETILINFLRGAGTTGLKGIPPVRDNFFIRPLFTVRRAEIKRYCAETGLRYRCDSSNVKPVYIRNRIRLQLIPLLEREYNPGLVPTLMRLGEICREEDSYLEEQAETAFLAALQEETPHRVVLRLASLRAAPLALRRRVLRRAWHTFHGAHKNLAFQHTETLIDLIREGLSGPLAAALPGNITAIRSNDTLNFVRDVPEPRVPCYIYPLQVPGETCIPEINRTLWAEVLSLSPEHSPKVLPPGEALLDYNKLPRQLFVRRRSDGDIFQPYGMASETKLKDFFIKQKIPREIRDKIPLVTTPEEIIWVAGLRTGEKWKVDPDTTRVLHLKVTTASG